MQQKEADKEHGPIEGDLQLVWENLEAARICLKDNTEEKPNKELYYKVVFRIGDLEYFRKHYESAVQEYEAAKQI